MGTDDSGIRKDLVNMCSAYSCISFMSVWFGLVPVIGSGGLRTTDHF